MSGLLHRRPWYAAGLAFECTGCGRCCAGPEQGYVWVTDRQITAIAEHLGISEDLMRRRYVRKVARRLSLVERAGSNDCIFLAERANGERRCRIYPVRPSQCRTWPFWPGNLRSPDSWALAQLRCEGISRGKVHNCDEIEANRRSTDA